MRWEGVHTALVTPFQGEHLDIPAFRLLVERQVAAGVSGLVPCGTTGETPTLEDMEWELLIAETVAISGGRLPVTAGVGTNSTHSTVQKVRRAKELGADAGLLVLPYYNKPNADGLRRHVEAAAGVGLPLVVYHVPGRTAQRLPATLLAELCDVPGVVACKEATGDVQYGQEVMLLTDTPILSGDDFTWMPLLSVGATGVISVLSNVAPQEAMWVWRHHQAGEIREAAALHKKLFPLIAALFREVNPVPVKAALAAMGLCSGELRLPLAPGAGFPAELLAGRK